MLNKKLLKLVIFINQHIPCIIKKKIINIVKNVIKTKFVDKKGFYIFDQYFVLSKSFMFQFLIKCFKTHQFFVHGILKNQHRLLRLEISILKWFSTGRLIFSSFLFSYFVHLTISMFRRGDLKKHYKFDCRCIACIENWPTVKVWILIKALINWVEWLINWFVCWLFNLKIDWFVNFLNHMTVLGSFTNF